MSKLFVEKKVSAKGFEFLNCYVDLDYIKQTLTMDKETILVISGLTARDLFSLPINEPLEIGSLNINN